MNWRSTGGSPPSTIGNAVRCGTRLPSHVSRVRKNRGPRVPCSVALEPRNSRCPLTADTLRIAWNASRWRSRHARGHGSGRARSVLVVSPPPGRANNGGGKVNWMLKDPDAQSVANFLETLLYEPR